MTATDTPAATTPKPKPEPAPKPRSQVWPQSGILNRPPEHNITVALTFTGAAAASPADARTTVSRLQVLVSRELRSDLDDQSATTPKDAPSPETGELGFDDNYDRAHLTITFAISKSGFDRLGVPTEDQPQDLITIPWAQLGDTPAVTAEQGDIALQICSDDRYICEHALRRVEEELGEVLAVTWVQVGAQRYTTRQGRTSRTEGRALIGFHDGTDNLDPRHDTADAHLVFVDPAAVLSYPPLPSASPTGYAGADAFPPDLRPGPAREPDWTAGGTYLTVRASTQNMAAWDDATLGDQERIVGRFKHSGAFLDLSDDPHRISDPPAFAVDPSNVSVPVDSHVRKVNPRRPEDADRRIFRRGYPLIAAGPAELSRGLLFICFARSLSTQFEFVMRAWMRNPNFPQPGAGADRLLAFDQALCGGYFFVPPVTSPNKPWTWKLPW